MRSLAKGLERVAELAIGLLIIGGCVAGGRTADSDTTARANAVRQDSVTSTADCVRGEPEPVLATKEPARPARFERTGTLSATEDFRLDDTTSLRLTNSGCAHYTETYAFTIRGATRDTTDSDHWLRLGAALLESLPVAEARESQMRELARTLVTRADESNPYAYGEPISIPELSTLSLAIERTNDAVVLEITYDVAL